MSRRALVLVVLTTASGCSRAPTRGDAAGPVDSVPVLAVAPVPLTDASATKLAAGCAVDRVETVDDGGGKPDEHGTTRLENLRVLAEGAATVLTWERQSDFQIGDSWRAPVVAEREGGGPFRVKELPVRAYACATYGYVGPLSREEHAVHAVTWGVNNANAFEIWSKEPETTGAAGMEEMKSRPARSRPTGRSSVAELATSRRVAFAATHDETCDAPCGGCPQPPRRGLWLFPLAPVAAKATKVASWKDAAQPPAPAIAMGDDKGVAAYRLDGALHLIWLDRSGTPIGQALPLTTGDVGAPAVAIAGSRVVVAWARREAKSDPYGIEWIATEHGAATLPAPRALATPENAFAPAVLTDGADVVLAWMQGDGGTKGAVFAARAPIDAKDPPAAIPVSSSDEANARDPELSGTVDAPALAYATFGKTRPGGVARLARLSCSR